MITSVGNGGSDPLLYSLHNISVESLDVFFFFVVVAVVRLLFLLTFPSFPPEAHLARIFIAFHRGPNGSFLVVLFRFFFCSRPLLTLFSYLQPVP